MESESPEARESQSANAQPRPSAPILPSYRLKYTLQGHKKALSSVKFSPDGKYIASACKANHLNFPFNEL